MFYVFHGEDSHSQKETLTKLKEKFGDASMVDLNTTRFEKPPLLTELKQACQAVPFLAKVRLVIVNNYLSTTSDKKTIKALEAFLQELPEFTRLFFLESKKLNKNNAILKLAASHEKGYAKQFGNLEGRALANWIQKQAEKKNGRISPRATDLLATNVGSDLRILDNELEKLVLFKQDEQIEAEDVLTLSPYAAEANIFELVDAIGTRNSKRAALLFQKKINEGADPFYLFSMFIRQFRLLVQAKSLLDTGTSPATVASEMKIHKFVGQKLIQQSKGFTLNQLKSIYQHLLNIDVQVKTGEIEMGTALNLLVAEVSH
ncbi:MAG: DNA polymerase III subunit delta [Chloroflexota bacterium]